MMHGYFNTILLSLTFVFSLQLAIAQSSQDSTIQTVTTEESPAKKKEKDGFFSMFEGKPGKAAFYSLIIPSGGQAYNKRFWKIPLVLAAEGVAIGFVVYNTQEFNELDTAYKGLLRGEIDNYNGVTDSNIVLRARENSRQYRDYSIFGFVLVHLIQISEAFVDAHLIDFDVSDDLSFDINIEATQHGVGIVARF